MNCGERNKVYAWLLKTCLIITSFHNFIKYLITLNLWSCYFSWNLFQLFFVHVFIAFDVAPPDYLWETLSLYNVYSYFIYKFQWKLYRWIQYWMQPGNNSNIVNEMHNALARSVRSKKKTKKRRKKFNEINKCFRPCFLLHSLIKI